MNQNNSQFVDILKSAFNTVEDILYIMEVQHDQFIYYFANQVGRSHLVYEQDIIGKTLHEVLPKKKADFLSRQYTKCAKQNKIVVFNDEVVRNNQHYINESVLTPFTFGNKMFIISVERDVTEYNNKIIELKRTKELIEVNEQRLTSLINNNLDGVISLDIDGYILDSNIAVKKIIGYTKLETIGASFSKFFPNNQLTLVNEKFQLALENEPVQFNVNIYHKDGTELLIQLSFIPVLINGKVRGVYGIAKDKTNEKKEFDKLLTFKNQLKSFVDHNSDAIHITDIDGKINFINDAFVHIFGFQKEDVIHKNNPTIPDWLIQETKQLFHLVLQGNSLSDVHVVRQKKNGELLDIRVTLSPIYDEFEEIIGLASIARNISIYKKNEKEMKNLNEQLSFVWNYSTDGIFFISHTGEILNANSSFKQMFLYNEWENLSLLDIYLDPQKNQMNEIIRFLQEKTNYLQFETKRKRKDGSVIDVLATYRTVNKGNTLAFATYKDITKEKQMLNVLAESEEKYRKVLDSSPDPLLIHNGEMITYINKAGLKLAKANKESLIVGKPISTFVHPKNLESVFNRIKLSTKKGYYGEPTIQQFVTVDGETIFAETSTASFQENGENFAIVMLRDVTQRLRAEKALKESEERFRIIAENTKSVIKILTPSGKITYCSPSIEEVLGYPVWNEMGRELSSNIYWEDLTLLESTLEKCIKTKASISIEIRHLHLDGYTIWLNSHFTPILNENNEVEKIILISNDITEQKQKEYKLTKLAYYDYLTNLPNRRLFNKKLKQMMLSTDETGKLSALMIIDCDHFKKINDTLGHDVGDEVIKEFANRLKLSLRTKDTISRIGGDEFTIVLPELNSKKEVKFIAERLLKKMREPMYIQGHEVQITASIGISIYSSNAYKKDELIKKADQNLYRSKEAGGNSYTID